jgi:hypothetical protein
VIAAAAARRRIVSALLIPAELALDAERTGWCGTRARARLWIVSASSTSGYELSPAASTEKSTPSSPLPVKSATKMGWLGYSFRSTQSRLSPVWTWSFTRLWAVESEVRLTDQRHEISQSVFALGAAHRHQQRLSRRRHYPSVWLSRAATGRCQRDSSTRVWSEASGGR